MITCEDFFAEMGDYLEDQVSPELRRELNCIFPSATLAMCCTTPVARP